MGYKQAKNQKHILVLGKKEINTDDSMIKYVTWKKKNSIY